ncbi:MAG TPA: tRNA uridine-5-carboxymethylaminomethyl(34) synthesis GTPase MnmE [Clostridia bacterium]|nr:tRNA uridine-5-carboxymethylaminomethyl(34) synthesis GTPase MnmE [Clostridia bacterium]
MEWDTIAAISTPIGEGGIGIVRVSGPEAVDIVEKVVESSSGIKIRDFPSHTLKLCRVKNPDTGEVVDEVMVSVMRAPKTFTREDVVEINCHGGAAPLGATLKAVLASGARLALPGEFSKRAFLNGRIDLAQAEAIIDVIRARTGKGLSAALDHLEGSLSREIRGIRDDLSGCLARIEVNIDFPGEDPDAEVTTEELGKNLSRIEKEIEKLLAGAGQGKVLREGLKTVIAGRPNVGKSSLLNALLREKRAIVTDIPGTTRDVIEEMLNLGGIPVRVLDTAGIRPTRDEVERIGVERSERALKEADLVLVIMDASTGLLEEDKGVLKKAGEARCLVVVNKSDLVEKVDIEGWEKLTSRECVAVSAKTGWGLSSLEEKIRGIIEKGEKVREGPLITRVRHEEALRKALKHIREAREACSLGVPEDIIAIDVREAWTSLGEITGDTASEEIVDRIFADFCIGK